MSSRAQQPAPVNFVVFEEIVSPSDMAAFSKVQQQAIDLMKKHQFNVPVYCYSTDDNIIYWVMPIKNFGSLDTIFEKSAATSKKMAEQDGFDGEKAFRDLSTVRSSVIQWSPELSYHPNSNFGQSPDKQYVEWAFCSLKSGHEKEAADAVKKYIDFYKKNGENYEWDVYKVLFGYDNPMWILMITEMNPVAKYQREADIFKKYSKEIEVLWSDLAQHMRKVENKTGWFRPTWSINIAQ